MSPNPNPNPPSTSTSSATLAPSEITPLLKQRPPSAHSVHSVLIDHERIVVPEVDSPDLDRNEEDGSEGEGPKGREVEVYVPGKSTFAQTMLNTLGDILGTGLLACPIAFAHAGWVLGPIMLVITGALTLFTLKLLLRIIEKDRRLRSFTDVIGYGLGPTGEKWVTGLFILEVAAWIVALVVLFSDTLEAVWPIFTSDQWKVVGLAIIIPTSFVPLRFLSFSSALGITSTWTLVGILIFSGIATAHAPGSLREPAATDLFPSQGWAKFATTFGLLLSGFGGHGLIPNLIRDMRNPKKADLACEMAYAIAMAIYLLVAICGYLMYGRGVSDEISKDLANTPGFSPVLNKTAVWMVALNPLTKIPLGVRPLSDVVYTWFGLHPTILVPKSAPTPRYVTRPSSPVSSNPAEANDDDDHDSTPLLPELDLHVQAPAVAKHNRHERLKAFFRPLIRVLLAVLAVVGALVMPSFEAVLSLLGSGFGIVSIVIIPIMAYANLNGWKWWYFVLCGVCGVAAVAGTWASFLVDSSAS